MDGDIYGIFEVPVVAGKPVEIVGDDAVYVLSVVSGAVLEVSYPARRRRAG